MIDIGTAAIGKGSESEAEEGKTASHRNFGKTSGVGYGKRENEGTLPSRAGSKYSREAWYNLYASS